MPGGKAGVQRCPRLKSKITGSTLPKGLVLTTDELGNYQVGQLPVGAYEVTVTAQGFAIVKMTSVPIVLGKNSRVDFKLEVKQTSEVVTISGDAIMVDTSVATLVKPKRQYDAVEARFDKRFAKNYQFVASYTWSRLFGNYSGLSSSDEEGRNSPNVNRYFDTPWQGVDQKGKLAEGRLATDRPHTFKLFGSYLLKNKLGNTTFSPIMQFYSGIPLTSEVAVITSATAMPSGRGDRGRTPFYSNFDLNLAHEFKPLQSHEAVRIRLELAVFNLFNQSTITDRFKTLQHSSDGQLQFDAYGDVFKGWDARALMQAQEMRVDPRYNLANSFQSPRFLRFQLSFFF